MYSIPQSTDVDGVTLFAPAPSAGEESIMLSFRLSYCQAQDWSQQTFAAAQLGDIRRSQRAAAIAQAMAEQPGASIPDLFDDPYAIKAAYGLFGRPEATPDRLQAPHRAAVAQALAAAGARYLLLEDTSELSWTNKKKVAGLGPIANSLERQQGFLLHSALAVRWPDLPAGQPAGRRPPLEVLGLADQLYEIRQPRPAGESHDDSMARQGRKRESHLWSTLGQRLGAAPAGARWEWVCDRAADIYEFLVQCTELGHGFTVRAAQDRALEDEQGKKALPSLFDTARAAAARGHFELELRGRDGQRARAARLAVAACAVRLRSPQRPGHASGSLAPLACTVVRVFEVEAPEGVEALEWILLTDAPVETLEQAQTVALKYSARWLIEEFHKGLKTGLGAERLQLETAQRLFAAIAIMSLVALRLIDLREAVRLDPLAPAGSGPLSALELQVLRARLKRPLQSVREVALAIGRLGGHMNRKGDGLPGWITLWRGMKKLHLLVQGVLLSRDLEKFG